MIFTIISCPSSAEVKTASSSCDTNVPQSQNKYETVAPKNEATTTCISDDNDGNEYENERIYEEIPDEMWINFQTIIIYFSLIISVSVIVWTCNTVTIMYRERERMFNRIVSCIPHCAPNSCICSIRFTLLYCQNKFKSTNTCAISHQF